MEEIFYNAAQGARKKDEKAIAYMSVPNQIFATEHSEARRAVEQGGVQVEGEKVTDLKTSYEKSAFENGMVVKRGKKNFKKVTL